MSLFARLRSARAPARTRLTAPRIGLLAAGIEGTPPEGEQP